jgi:hypothetical protein
MDDKVVLPPTVTSESILTRMMNHVREYKLIYAGLAVLGGIVIYKKLLAK